AAREAAAPVERAQVIPKQPMEIAIPARRSPLILVGAILAFFWLVAEDGADARMHFMGKRTATGSANPAGGPDASVPLHEVARYWIEVESKKGVGDFRAGDSVQLESGQRFKFGLSPNENGYIYLIGPGENNAPMIFLSAKPTDRSGLKTNEVRSGLVFSFPADTNQKANFIG